MSANKAYVMGFLCGYAGHIADPYIMGYGQGYLSKQSDGPAPAPAAAPAPSASGTEAQVNSLIQGIQQKQQDPRNAKAKVKKIQVSMEMADEKSPEQLAAEQAGGAADAAAPVPPAMPGMSGQMGMPTTPAAPKLA